MKPRSHALRKGRSSIPGYCYFVTAATHKRQPVFADYSRARHAARAFYASSLKPHAETLAYVVMPDHIHWLLQLESDLSGAVRLYKSIVSIQVGQPLWQSSFHDHALRQDEDLAATARYIVANPLRAELVQHVGDYPYWNAIWL